MALIPLKLAPKIQIWIAGDYASVLFANGDDVEVYAYDVEAHEFVNEAPPISLWMRSELDKLIEILYLEEGNGTFDYFLDAHHAEELKWLS